MPKGKTLKESAGVSARLATADTRPHVEILREQWLKRHDPASVLPEDERLSLEWSNITYKVPIIKRSFGREVSRTEKTILRDVSGFVPAGSLVVRSSLFLSVVELFKGEDGTVESPGLAGVSEKLARSLCSMVHARCPLHNVTNTLWMNLVACLRVSWAQVVLVRLPSSTSCRGS
jgi:hypothetical protein